jgi:hypothetical protein
VLDLQRDLFQYPDAFTLENTLELVAWFGAEEAPLPPEYHYKLIYTATKYGRIYSNDGKTWYSASGTRIE